MGFCLVLCSQLLACSGVDLPFMGKGSSAEGAAAPVQERNAPKKIVMLLPLQGKYGESGQAVKNGFMAAFYANKGQKETQPVIKVLDTSNQNINVVYEKAVADGADIIVGPLDKDQVQTLIKNARLTVPTLALNTVTDQKISNLYQFGLSQLDEADQVAQRAANDGHRRALVIAPAGAWGSGVVSSFKNRWESAGGTIADQVNYKNSQQLSEQIRQVLHVEKSKSRAARAKQMAENSGQPVSRRRQDIDMIFLVAEPDRAREIIPMLKFYYAGNIPVYATSLVFSGHRNPDQDNDLNNLQFTDMPWVLGGLPENLDGVKANVAELWKSSYAQNPKLYALGVDAYQLSQNLHQIPAEGFRGATGTLYIQENQHIYRKLSWAKIRGGSPGLF